jgi:hypothetical protein
LGGEAVALSFPHRALCIIRTSGERTEAECARLCAAQFPNLHMVRLSPFAEAVRACLQAGIDSGLEWLVTVDADVLIAPGLTDYAERVTAAAGPDDWHVIGHMDDMPFPEPRQGGVRLWKTIALPSLIGHVNPDAIRPESALCRAYSAGLIETQEITGRHDYEQWRRDLYRKGAAHRRKHSSWGKLGIPAWWREKAETDTDYRAILQGWERVTFDCPEKDAMP